MSEWVNQVLPRPYNVGSYDPAMYENLITHNVFKSTCKYFWLLNQQIPIFHYLLLNTKYLLLIA